MTFLELWNRVALWVNLTHVAVGLPAGFVHWVMGVFVAGLYLGHEVTQAKAAGGWQRKNTVDLLSAWGAVLLGVFLNRLFL